MGKLDRVAIRLVKEAEVLADYPVNTPESAVRLVQEVIGDMDRENMCIINLRSDGTPVNFEIASIGAINATLATPRELMKTAILSNAASVIAVHNHPSGSLRPSEEDKRVTERLYAAYSLMGITMWDHIIVGHDRNKIYSFQAEGEMDAFRYQPERYRFRALFDVTPEKEDPGLIKQVAEKQPAGRSR